MCGRKYASEELTWAEYREALDITGTPPNTNFQPNYNIAPTHVMPVAVHESTQHVLRPMMWGLVPTWAKDATRSYNMINARAETLEEKPSFKNLLKSCRCAVLVSGFYEWKRDGKTKQAYRIERADGEPMILAGLWAENGYLETTTYSIITTNATPAFGPIHNRLPAILERDQVATWLHGQWSHAKSMTEPYSGDLDVKPVGNAVGNVRNNYAELLEVKN
ncbi:MAG: SOS response-associated peptidase [Parasphingorhabdus sp.]